MASEPIREPELYIGGEWVVGGGGECEVENPSTEQLAGIVTQASRTDVDRAVDAARDAFDPWASMAAGDRIAALRRLRDVIADRADVFAELITLEQGSPPTVARKLHVDMPLEIVTHATDLLEKYPFRRQLDNSVILREPVGVVAAITPWSLPLYQILVKVVPILAAGCTVVLKPATLTPLTAFELARAFESVGFPPGVFNLVAGRGCDVGDQLCRNPNVDHVSFTGSTNVGRQVAAAAVDTLKGVTLELDGKSSSVVLSDVSDDLLAKAVRVTVANCFLNSGQMATALSRLIVPESRLAQVEELAVAVAAKYVPGERLGPLISSGRRFAVESYLELGVAKVLTASVPLPEKGYFVSPTIFSEVDPGSILAQEEILGPVLSIIPVQSDDHAIEVVNSAKHALRCALWVEDGQRALEWAARIRTGQVSVNAEPFNPRSPFGGYKQSGIGREIDYGIDDVLKVKAVQLSPGSP